jgi:hypothetical protein
VADEPVVSRLVLIGILRRRRRRRTHCVI